MKAYTIPQKMSNSGSIHDLSSSHYDRIIRFRSGTHYAVVLAAYYGERSGKNLYTTHKTEATAAKASRALSASGTSHEIIDATGKRYMADYDRLHVCS